MITAHKGGNCQDFDHRRSFTLPALLFTDTFIVLTWLLTLAFQTQPFNLVFLILTKHQQNSQYLASNTNSCRWISCKELNKQNIICFEILLLAVKAELYHNRTASIVFNRARISFPTPNLRRIKDAVNHYNTVLHPRNLIYSSK